MWHLTPDTWLLTPDSWWTLCKNFRSLALTVWKLWCFEDLEEKDHLRGGPASLHSLITGYFHGPNLGPNIKVYVWMTRIFQNIMFFQKNISCNLKTRIVPNFKPFQCFNQTLNQIRPFKIKICMSFIWHDTLMTFVPVLGDEHFQFLWSVIFGNFCSNWFKLVSANPPNSQTFKQKRKLRLRF